MFCLLSLISSDASLRPGARRRGAARGRGPESREREDYYDYYYYYYCCYYYYY